jgi:hypothetical protein
MEAIRDARHREIWELIPWIVTGHAAEAECETVRVHCLHCSNCADELRFQQVLQLEMAKESGRDFDAERGWARLQRDIEIRSDDDGEEVLELSSRRVRPALRLRQVLAIMAVEALVLGLAGATLLHGSGRAGQPYQTLAANAQTPRGATVRLVVSPDLSIAQLATLLRSLKMQIVEGPSDLGAFALAPIDFDSETEAVVARLRATPGVRLAEPIH